MRELYANYAIQFQKYYPLLSEQEKIKFLAKAQKNINHFICLCTSQQHNFNYCAEYEFIGKRISIRR